MGRVLATKVIPKADTVQVLKTDILPVPKTDTMVMPSSYTIVLQKIATVGADSPLPASAERWWRHVTVRSYDSGDIASLFTSSHAL